MFPKCRVTLIVAASLLTVICASPELVTTAAFQQQEKEAFFKDFSDKKRADPKEAYRIAKSYLEKFGKDADDNTKYVKEWVVAYEAVVSRTGATDSKIDTGATSRPVSTASNPGKPLDMNGTTWQVKGKEDGKTWAEIFVFKSGGRFQYEKYGVDGSSNVRAGTWRQLDENIFATLLGPDGNTTGTVRAELQGGCLKATLVFQGQPEWRFMMETDTAPNACTVEREAELRYESDPVNARRLFRALINSVGKTSHRFDDGGTLRFTTQIEDTIPEFDGCVMPLMEFTESMDTTPDLGVQKSSYSVKMMIPLSTVDHTTIKVDFQKSYGFRPDAYIVGFTTKNKEKTIIYTRNDFRDQKTERDLWEAYAFYLGDQEKATRAARALTQLVKACQQNTAAIEEYNEARRKEEEKERAEQAKEQAKLRAEKRAALTKTLSTWHRHVGFPARFPAGKLTISPDGIDYKETGDHANASHSLTASCSDIENIEVNNDKGFGNAIRFYFRSRDKITLELALEKDEIRKIQQFVSALCKVQLK